MHTWISRLLASGIMLTTAAPSVLAQLTAPPSAPPAPAPPAAMPPAAHQRTLATTTPLTVLGSDELSEFVQHTRGALHGQAADNGEDLWHMVVAHLRLGQPEQAKALLTAHTTSQQPELILAAFATWQQATGVPLLTPPHRRALERALDKVEQQPFASFRDGCLQVHGRYCLSRLDAATHRARHERLATTRLLALENETWQPGRGHYRPTACNGQLRVPASADASLLQPLTYGMLLASGDRLTRHLRNTLAAARSHSLDRWHPQVPPAQLSPLLLTAAAQLGANDEMTSAYKVVVAQRTHECGDAARNFNAVLQAITGVRLAAGGGLSPHWLRMTPWLPESCDKLILRDMHALGHCFSLTLQRTEVATGLRVRVRKEGEPASRLPIVVANRWQQFVTELTARQPFECELAGAKLAPKKPLPPRAEPDHDALDRFGFRSR